MDAYASDVSAYRITTRVTYLVVSFAYKYQGLGIKEGNHSTQEKYTSPPPLCIAHSGTAVTTTID